MLKNMTRQTIIRDNVIVNVNVKAKVINNPSVNIKNNINNKANINTIASITSSAYELAHIIGQSVKNRIVS